MLDGASLSALVVGGGPVATRKARALLHAGASVHVVAPEISPALADLAASSDHVRITRAVYAREHLGDALVVIAATNDNSVNAGVAADARAAHRLVNVAGEPDLGNCVTPAVHRAGDVVIAVGAGRAPGAAARIRDAIARVVDARYANAVRELTALRRTLIDRGQRDRWAAAAAALVGPDFCDDVESGRLATRMAEWA